MNGHKLNLTAKDAKGAKDGKNETEKTTTLGVFILRALRTLRG
jgi:hypothetical protein